MMLQRKCSIMAVPIPPKVKRSAVLFAILLVFGSLGVASAAQIQSPIKAQLKKTLPLRLKAPPATAAPDTAQQPPSDSEPSASEPTPSQPAGPQGGTGAYVLDNVDFHPLGGKEIPGLGWNNQVPLSGYYRYDQNSYIFITGTVHGDGLISGPGQDGWTFVVKHDNEQLVANRPPGCQFSVHNRAQTDPAVSGWKYQIMIDFRDTATKPECFDYVKSLAGKPFMVRLADIVGPYWTGDKQYQEPRVRYFQAGPLLSLDADLTAGHSAVPWNGPLP